ncbi:MAG TPA: AraC family transcriptional regulator [Microscillaceae bacterium]|nr:AraC family transcriptional regulator [Microscillaceae bacterium]
MPYTSFRGEFIEQAEAFILENFSNEQFGVSELADLMHMSRSNLLRKVKKQTDLSVSQFIRLIRLQKGMELLEQTELTVSEISYQVGFGNNSYFIKCFREHYGRSPGEVRKGVSEKVAVVNRDDEKRPIQVVDDKEVPKSFFNKYRLPIIVATFAVLVLGGFLFLRKTPTITSTQNVHLEKSIAILPFKNMSSDSANLYFVDGLMESSLNNLQKIKDLRVISRTSVEKYRNTRKNISEIAKELNVSYLVEGSGQRIGNQVLLNIQLIEAASDTPVWSKQYNYQVVNIFSLQNEVAKKIANAIKAKVTPAELEQIDKKPTKNLLAYDYYLRAMELFQAETEEGLKASIPLFEKAIQHDPRFSMAYAKIARAYFYLDFNKTEKRYTDIINRNADKALLYDTKSAESLIAKALYYINNREFQQVVPHLEKALEYNPNSASVVNLLSHMYAQVIPNTAKYLKYALRGIQLDIASNDSIGKSYIYLHLSNAFIQNGFVEEAQEYINLSLSHHPENEFAPHLKIFIDHAQHQNIDKTTNLLAKEWKKDTTRLDILQDVAKLYYFQAKYDSAFYYYQKFVKFKKKNNVNIYPFEDLKIGITYEKMGRMEQAANFYRAFSKHCQVDQSIYQPAGLAAKYVHEGKLSQAIEQLKIFASKNNYQYWIVLFLEKDPLMKPLKNNPEFESVMKKIKQQFWENKAQLKKSLVNYY